MAVVLGAKNYFLRFRATIGCACSLAVGQRGYWSVTTV